MDKPLELGPESHQLLGLVSPRRGKVSLRLGFSGDTTMRIEGAEHLEVYTPETVRDLRIALRSSWNLLCTHQSPFATESRRDTTQEMLARRLLRCAAAGETNKARLVTYALGSFV